MSERTEVRFEVRGDDFGAQVQRVDLMGEISDWINPRPLERGADGSFARTIALPDGVYAYKYRVDDAWHLDPKNARTRSTGGARNNVISVGGAPEPILHAPGAPFVVPSDGGGVVIVAALRRGAGDSLALKWSEDGEPKARVAMEKIADEDEHLVFRVRLPASAARVRYAFDLADHRTIAREDGAPFEFALPRAANEVPAWWRDALVYTIYVDRFRAAHDRATWERDPGPRVAAGGHLEGIRRSLDDLIDLGINTLYLTPIHVAESSHRYDFVDPQRIDPRLGGDEAFSRLLEDAHAKGLRVLLDFSLSHAGLGFPACADVIARGRASKFADWFQWNDRGELKHYGRRKDAPLVNLEHPEVQALAIEIADGWIARGIDGFRLDMAAEVPLDLARRIRARLRQRKPDAIVLGELVPAHAWRWRGEEAVDAATDFGFHGLATDLLARGSIGPDEFARKLVASAAQRGLPDHASLRFLSTHDHPRFSTIAKFAGKSDRVALGQVLLFTMPGVPALLYGEELGLVADIAELEVENAWPDRMPMPWTTASRRAPIFDLTRKLIALRAKYACLRSGELRLEHADGSLLVYRRVGAGEAIDVVIHLGDEAIEIALRDDEHPGIDLLAKVGDVTTNGDTVTLGPRAAAVFARSHVDKVPARTVTTNELVRDREFAANGTRGAARPTRIDFAVTERCNLRCAHCITFAPARTEAGTARTLTRWILDQLRDDLRFASYFGFVHGGESLTAPIFSDVLDAIRAARGSMPYVVHLLSNGVMLTDRIAARLVETGVNSIAVSLDGATAATNDAIRLGGRFEKIISNLRDVVRFRTKTKADLRLGLSYVVMQSNRHELRAFVELAVDIGVDWVKFEEAVPVNAFAKNSLVQFDQARARAEADDAVAYGRSRGLVVVDHTASPIIWRCKLADEPRVASFLRDDEYANRSSIHPCRAPWEIACIEPNGDVRLSDFFGPIVGNVSGAKLLDLWRSNAAHLARTRTQAERLCGPNGPVVCVEGAKGAK